MINYKKYIKIAIEQQDYQLEDIENYSNHLWINGKLLYKNEKKLLQLVEGA